MGDLIRHPFGKAEVQKPAFAAALAVTIRNSFTILQVALTGAMTLNVTVDAECPVGSVLVLRLTSDGTARDTTLGTAIDGPIITGVISKTKSQAFFLDDDGVFKPMGAQVQVD